MCAPAFRRADNPPDTFCWDVLCGGRNPQVQDRDDLEDKNVDRRVEEFIAAARAMAATRKGDEATMNVMWNMGRYDNADSAPSCHLSFSPLSEPPHQHMHVPLSLTCLVAGSYSDFQYESAERFFINMDKIIKAVNADGRVQAQYSTPSIYYRAKLQENITWSVKTDDFLYASQHT